MPACRAVNILFALMIPIAAFSQDSNNGLIAAARAGNTPKILALLDAGAKVDMKNRPGWTALMMATWYGHGEIVNILLKRGANANAKNNDGKTALSLAAQIGHMDIVRSLLNGGADVNAKAKDGTTALGIALAGGQTKVVHALLEAGAEVKPTKLFLMNAARHGDTDTVELLLNRGAKVDGCTDDGVTPLEDAAGKGHAHTVGALLEHGADVNAKDDYGTTPLMRAAANGDTETVRVLLDNGAEVDARHKLGWTALMLAELYGNAEAKQLLNKAGSRPANTTGEQPGPRTLSEDRYELVETSDEPPVLRHMVRPDYTKGAIERKIEGDVFIQVLIRKDGTATPLRVVRGLDLALDLNAIEAVRQFVFTPGKVGGVAVDLLAEISVSFHLQ